MLSWQVHLFGQFECTQGDRPSNLPAASDARSLLAYLFLHTGRAFPRSVLAALIAPDLPDSQALHALSQALWHIRRSLPGLLESDASQVGIAPQLDVWVDALEFQTLAERSLMEEEQPADILASLRQAVDLYRGDLLDGYYEEWALIERERLRGMYLQALEKLVIAYKAALQYQQALATALRLVGADPLNESAHREVMRLYHYLGRPAEALRQYEICRDILRKEFNLDPETETIQIVQAIAQRSGHATAPYVPEPQSAQGGSRLESQDVSAIPLIGRSQERARLVDWLQQNQSGYGKLILVEGEAGVGKTRLLQEVRRDLEWHGVQVLWGKAMPFTDSRPLGALAGALDSGLTPLRTAQLQHLVEPLWLQVLQPLLPRVAEHLTGLEPLPMLEDRQAKIRLLEGLIRILTAWAQINPLVIIIEDLHWADADTVDTLTGLAYRLEKVNVSLVCSYRSEDLAGLPEIQAKLDAIRPEVVRGRLELTGLSAPAVHELIHASLGGEATSAFDARLFQETEGNPLFILELLRGLYDEGVLRINEAGAWITPYDSAMGDMDLPLPPAVEQVIMRRLEQLPSDLRDLLEGLAVLGGEFSFDLLTSLGLADAPTLVTWLQKLTRRRLLTESPQAYRFSHDKIRQVVYEYLGAVQRTAWHARLAGVLEQVQPDRLEALAYHYTQAQDWKKAVDYHWRSAEKTRRANAYASALEHLDLALRLADQAQLPTEEQFRMLESHVEIVAVLDNNTLYQSDLDAMQRLAGSDPLRLAQTRQRRIEFLIQTFHYAEGESAARQAVSLAEQQEDRKSQAAALTCLGIALDMRGEQHDATASLERAIRLYQQLGDRRGEADARSHLANILAKSEQRVAARLEFEAALAIFEAIDYQPGCADTLSVLGILSSFDADFEASLRYSSRALQICRAIGYRMGEAYASHQMGSVLMKLGQIGKSIRVFQDTLELCLAIGDQRMESVTRNFLSEVYCNYVGDYEIAIRSAQVGLATAQAIADPILEGMCQNNLGDALLQTGRLDEARLQQEQALDIFQANHGGLRMPEVYLSLANIYLHGSQLQAAQENLEMAETLIRRLGLGIFDKSLLSLRAELMLGLERPEEALEWISQVVSRLSTSPGIRYRTYLLHYRILNRLGRSFEARQALKLAYQDLMTMLAGLTPEQQAMSRTSISEHRDILQAWQALQPRRITVRLPRASAPLGRPLHADEWVEIDWTVAAPEDDAIPGKVGRRRARLLRLLQEARDLGATPSSEHLAQALGVSLRTIAADLVALKSENDDLIRSSLRGHSG